MTPPENVYVVVVVGAMNPAIHHPGWYQVSGIMSSEEAATASKEGVVVVSPQIAQFKFGSISITCDPLRWQIQTEQGDKIDRVLEIAEKTFEKLYHTPVSAFGFNFLHHRQVSAENVAGLLGAVVRSLPLGLLAGSGGRESAKLTHERVEGGRVIRITIEPSVRGADHVFVAINIEHRTEPSTIETYKQFDLRMRDAFATDRGDAIVQFDSVLRAIEELAKAGGIHRNGA